MQKMSQNELPHFSVPPKPVHWDPVDLQQWDWNSLPSLPPLILADGSGPAAQQTRVRLCQDEEMLYVHFDCDDEDIWGAFTERDDPIYDEEVVELFIAAGEETPIDYYEFEISPNGVLFDARIYNPTSDRKDIQVDIAWDAPGIHWSVDRNEQQNHWSAILALPWSAIAPAGQRSTVWRANFYRIERPRPQSSSQPTEFSCWSPTLTDPADFHKPARFGYLNFLR
jgi:hypothetical protein